MLATLTYAGLRISELLDLEWRDLDLATGRLHVRKSKTPAGRRTINLLPVLREELVAYKQKANATEARQLVFPSAAGARQDRNRVRARVLAGAIKTANEALADEGLASLPEGLTLHALRRTFASVLVALGKDVRYVMGQLGHTNPMMTLGIYAKVMDASDEERARLRALVDGESIEEAVVEAVAA
jgi:integrase